MQTIEILKELIKFKSITPSDDGALNFIAMLVPKFNVQFFNRGKTKNLFLSRKFGDGAHLCFAGHVDVVPPGTNWKSDPFEPVIKDGFLYGRGTQDMKGGVAAVLGALNDEKAQNFNGTLSVLLTSDEEGDGLDGTKFALEKLRELNLLPDYAVVAEPTSETKFGDMLKIGRRGSINGTLVINGTQGHAAYPQKCINPAHLLAQVFANFAGYDLDKGDANFAPSKIVITDIRGGMEVCNVTPAQIKIMFNVRNSPSTTLQNVQDYCEKLFGKFDYELNLTQSSKPFLTSANSPIAINLAQSIEKITGFLPKFGTGGGTSDARHFANFGVKVVEFGVINDRIHAVDERVDLQEVLNLSAIFADLISNFKG